MKMNKAEPTQEQKDKNMKQALSWADGHGQVQLGAGCACSRAASECVLAHATGRVGHQQLALFCLLVLTTVSFFTAPPARVCVQAMNQVLEYQPSEQGSGSFSVKKGCQCCIQ
jgi:hypothetical protein